jgi:hypothetical protein
MRWLYLHIALLMSSLVFGQKARNDIAYIPYPARIQISGINQKTNLSKASLLNTGFKVILDDTTFKVTSFKITYDCHSRSLFDFSTVEYTGDKVRADDKYLKAIWVGDVIDLLCVNITKDGKNYVMKETSFIIVE